MTPRLAEALRELKRLTGKHIHVFARENGEAPTQSAVESAVERAEVAAGRPRRA